MGVHVLPPNSRRLADKSAGAFLDFQERPKLYVAVESQVSKNARPGAPPFFPLSALGRSALLVAPEMLATRRRVNAFRTIQSDPIAAITRLSSRGASACPRQWF